MAETNIRLIEHLDQIEDLLLDGTRIPFSGGRLVNEQDAIELIDAVRESVPGELTQAVDLIRQREEFIAQAQKKAEEIKALAQREREQLISNASVLKEAERKVSEMREQTRQQCEQLLQQCRQQAATEEQEHQGRQAQLEQQFAARRQQLEQEAAERNRSDQNRSNGQEQAFRVCAMGIHYQPYASDRSPVRPKGRTAVGLQAKKKRPE